MADLIKLLPNHIANQIAAGEVVQRPASVVKELIENAIDAGATEVNLVAKDGGKTLIQVIDNGCGMSAIDARMSFERHATSKIQKAEDIFQLQTKGFRGEALASIASIAHVHLKTKLHNEELGTEVINEGSKIKSQEPVSATNGTSISVKNLFYNIPARRNFLGSNITEYRHILTEFLRVTLVHPDVVFSFHHNGDEIYQFPAAGLRQRIVHAFGKNYNQRLVPVEETTDIFSVSGFIVKPEYARSSRDQMFLFVNNRYFKDRYFGHAIQAAFEGMIPSNKYPAYFLYFTVPTESIDVNVHPTKTEIKFENNKEIYAILRSAIKQAIGQYNISPSLDFDAEQTFDTPSPKIGDRIEIPTVKVDPNFNPFHTRTAVNSNPGNGYQGNANNGSSLKPEPSQWENFYENLRQTGQGEDESGEMVIPSKIGTEFESTSKAPYQLHTKYILTSIKNGMILIDQYRAHSRIIFDKLLLEWDQNTRKSQQLLFPEEFEISATDIVYFKDIAEQLSAIGFDFELVENKKIVVSGTPIELKGYQAKTTIDQLLADYKLSEQKTDINVAELVLKSVVAATAIKGGTQLGLEQMQHIIDELFACENHMVSPHGKPIMITYTLDEITKKFT